MSRNRLLIDVTVSFLGAIVGLIGVAAYNEYVLPDLSMPLRAVSLPLVYWLIAVIPILVMINGRERPVNYGFQTKAVGSQIVIGVALGLILSLVLTLLPNLLGYGGYVSSDKEYQHLWQYVYEFVYCIIAVGAVEEFVFRGVIFEKLKKMGGAESMAALACSILFGAFHFLGGSVVQMGATAVIGLIFCACKLRIKHCSLLSLALAHGIYDAMIVVWTGVFAATA